MSSAPPERPARGAGRARGTLALRLTLGYALLFALSATALFGLTYAALLGSMRQQDRAYAAALLDRYAGVYARAGLAGVHRAARAVQADDRGEETLARAADARARTLLLLPPEDWTPATGSYQLNADCTGEQELNIPGSPFSPVILRMSVSANGTRVNTVVSKPGYAVSSTGTKVNHD